MIHRFRRTAAVLMTAGCVCSVAACGSSSSSSSKSSSSSRPSFAGGHGGGFSQLTSSERSCLSKHGLKLPAGGAGTHRAGGFKGGHGSFPKGKRPNFKHGTPPKGFKGAHRFGGGQGGTYEKAMKACGVKVPSFHGGAGGGGAGGTQTSSAS